MPPNWKLGGKGRKARALRDKESAYGEADLIWDRYRNDPKFMFGLALYIGEGSKAGSTPGVTNCDTRVVFSSILFLKMLGVKSEEIRVHLNVHSEDQIEPAEEYWSKELNLPRTQFLKTVINKVGHKGDKPHKQPFGTCQIRAQGRRLMSILERLSQLAFDEVNRSRLV